MIQSESQEIVKVRKQNKNSLNMEETKKNSEKSHQDVYNHS